MHKVFLIQNLQDFLSEHQKFKLEVSRTSLNRYLANGLVTEARSLNGSGVPGGRKEFHPLAVFEVVAAIYLYAGDWLLKDSDFRMARLMPRDIFIGRLAYFADQQRYDTILKYCKDNGYENFSTFEFDSMTQLPDKELYIGNGSVWLDPLMTLDQIKKLLTAAKRQLLDQFETEQSVNLYVEYQEMLYQRTFDMAVERYGQDLKKFIG